uniref:Cubilin n=1 Tax=Branchiostoma floridae TaxID=7739 RepID=C3XQR0_BRAFL|eukprot:XP_002613627.1 hypothetical protein BRAFLDRAFT_93668 [Branchiostoma floridae]
MVVSKVSLVLFLLAVAFDSGSAQCDETLRSTAGVISSPGYPGDYPPRVDYTWCVDVEGATAISVTFLGEFQLEINEDNDGTESCKDSMEIGQGNIPFRDSIGIFCGNSTPPAQSVGTGQMWVNLYSDRNVEMAGFQLVYRSDLDVCYSSPCTNGGTCMSDLTTYTYTCSCPPGWDGASCEVHVVWQSDKCYRFSDDSMSNQEASSICVSINGHLADIQDTAQQQLLAGYMDPAHDASFWVANKISSSSCGLGDGSATSSWMYNNGSINFDICVLLNSAYGYKGTYQRCEEQHNYICESSAGPCQPNVCQHGGYCVSCFGESSIFCICPQGYSGPRCEIVDLCLPSPCPFDWTCSIQAGGIHCAVPAGVKATRSGFCTATSCGAGLFCIEDGPMGYSCIRG